ncbi:hypothetical protein EZV73_09685 [Acidaminobacter sp. JC074]|uniref:hypothetical protein n=1 Tax=Acidaminobacter sp. JC074 TaxID=2530199 RepID=UPI001F10D779|nr:hypothetical protein [Acidaminobacter sp. JC074]MCH4887844.1 hypothetical protein [Acidaminobacter sp. JC074]
MSKKRWLVLILTSIIVLIFAYRHMALRELLGDLKEAEHSHMFVEKIGVGVNEHHTLQDPSRIENILEKIYDIPKFPTKIKSSFMDNVSYKGRYDVELRIADDQSPPNYTKVIFMGNEYLQVEVFNKATKMVEIYRAKVRLSDEEMNELIVGD